MIVVIASVQTPRSAGSTHRMCHHSNNKIYGCANTALTATGAFTSLYACRFNVSTAGNKSADAVPRVANFWQESPMGIGPSARLEGHFSPVTPLPDAVRVRPDSERSSDTAGASASVRGEAPPPSPEQTSAERLTDGDSDDSGMSLSSSETDPELCVIGRAMALRSNPSSISPPWSDSSPDSPVLPPGGKATSTGESRNMTDYKLMSNSKGDDLYAELLQAQGVDVTPRDEDDQGQSAFSTTSTIKAEAADSATWRCVEFLLKSRLPCAPS